MNQIKSLLHTSLSLLALGIGDAAALTYVPKEDDTIYAGNQCRAVYGQQAGDLDAAFNALVNRSGGTREIVCPVIRHYPEKDYGVLAFYVQVDNAQASRLTCSFYVLDGVGNPVRGHSISTESIGSQYLQPSRFGYSARKYSGEYTMYCQLPPGSSILNYRVSELH